MATPAKFALQPDPKHPGLETIMADRGNGWYVVRQGKFSPAENEAQIKRLEKNGIIVVCPGTIQRRKP